MEEASGPPVEVWPDNLNGVNAFIAMATQWRASFAGFYGLDYSALPAVLELIGVPADERADAFDDLRILEATALDVFSEQNAKQR